MAADAFTAFIQRYGDAHPPSMRYHTGDDFPTWQQHFSAAVRALRGPVPERVSGEPDVLETVAEDTHTRYRICMPVSEAASCSAHLLVPKDIQPGERRPAAIVYHGHESDINAICGVFDNISIQSDAHLADLSRRAYARLAAEAGYVVMSLPLWGWHGRDAHLDLIRSRDKCNVIQMAAAMYGINPLALHLQDGEAALDYLCSRDDVDADRIACLGNSTGGRTTMWLTALDQRIKACVPSGCMNTFRERSLKLASCGIQYFPGLLEFGDVPELLCLIAPRAMQLQAGEGDTLITPADRDAMRDTVQAAYDCIGSNAFEYVLHPHNHMLEWAPAARFLDTWL